MRRQRNAKIIATLGPSSADESTIRDLFESGADLFRLNFSHGSHEQHAERVRMIRRTETDVGRPIGILMDLQGPKLRVGRFVEGPIRLHAGDRFRLDLQAIEGDKHRVGLPHPEIFAALRRGTSLLVNDGLIRLEVVDCGADYAQTKVVIGGEISDNKGVNVPGVILPLSPLTQKDRVDLAAGLAMGVDWVALSFVQKPQDLTELRKIVGNRASVMAKLEKPAAVDCLDGIVQAADAVMVARGDLGVELAPAQVPTVQKRIIRACRQYGKPVVVATQMLDSMMRAPVPTRAEASDVATAVYDGADAVMLSGETAAGNYPREAVTIMNDILVHVERDSHYRQTINAQHLDPEPTTADAICNALHSVAQTLTVAATVTYTNSGFSSLRAARERPEAPILSLTPIMATARRICLVWGVHSVKIHGVEQVQEMVDRACHAALNEGFAVDGERIVIAAGVPFGTAGTTNLLRVARIRERRRRKKQG